jgi:hypothetical protein
MQSDSITATARAQVSERAPAEERAQANVRAAARLLDSYKGVGDLTTAARLIQMAVNDLREAEKKKAAGGPRNAPAAFSVYRAGCGTFPARLGFYRPEPGAGNG